MPALKNARHSAMLRGWHRDFLPMKPRQQPTTSPTVGTLRG